MNYQPWMKKQGIDQKAANVRKPACAKKVNYLKSADAKIGQ